MENNNDLMEKIVRYFNSLTPDQQEEFLKGLTGESNKKITPKTPKTSEERD